MNGVRGGPVRTYLPLAQALDNFKLELHTKVIRAVRTNSTITGVEVEVGGGARETINLKPGGKVILASGAMSTPRVLFNSGIGPAEQIQNVASGNTRVRLPEDYPFPAHVASRPRDFRLAWFLIQEVGVAAIPPTEFYTDPNAWIAEDYMRFAVCKEDRVLEEAKDRLRGLKRYIE